MLQTGGWIFLFLVLYQSWMVSGGNAQLNCTSDEECPSEIGIFGVTVTYKCGKKPKQYYMAERKEVLLNDKKKNVTFFVPDPMRNSNTVCECDKIGDAKATLLYFDGIQYKNDSTPKECGIAAGEECLSEGGANNKIGRGCASLQCLVDRKPEICEGVTGEFIFKVPRNCYQPSLDYYTRTYLIFIVAILMIIIHEIQNIFPAGEMAWGE